MPAVKISPVFQQINHWENFAAHFYNYKVCGERPSIGTAPAAPANVIDRRGICDVY